MAGGKNESSSTISTRSLSSAGVPLLPWVPTTTPVTVRVPTGTRTRAPTRGDAKCDGTLYVRRSRNGTGTATETRRNAGLLVRAPGKNGADFLHVFPDVPLR